MEPVGDMGFDASRVMDNSAVRRFHYGAILPRGDFIAERFCRGADDWRRGADYFERLRFF